MRVIRNKCSVLLGKPEGKRSLGRTNSMLEDNIIVDLKKYIMKLWIEFV